MTYFSNPHNEFDNGTECPNLFGKDKHSKKTLNAPNKRLTLS